MADVGRLEIAVEVTAHQRQWFADLREAVERGERYAICAADEFEEFFLLFGIPAVVVNYWHNLVVASGQQDHYTDVLRSRGYDYDRRGMGPLGYASALEPANAPWGGLPTPSIMLGSTRDEGEFRFLELWAKEYGCPYYPMEFNLAGPYKQIAPDGWWRDLVTNWRSYVDPDQLALRVAQTRNLISYMEHLTGTTLRVSDIAEALSRVNEQMSLVGEALDVIATADRCPATLRDQLAMYQAMWHRGTERGVDFARRFRDEVAERAAAGVAAYPNEQYRLLYWTGLPEPRFHRYLQETYGAVIVGNLYSACPQLYARDFDPEDPLPAFCSRNLFLLAHETPGWMVEMAQRFGCDGIIGFDRTYPYESVDSMAAQRAGIPYVNVPHIGDGDDVRGAVDQFMTSVAAARELRSQSATVPKES